MKHKPPLVTDRALIDYLECSWGVDVRGLRARMARMVTSAQALGASSIVIDGVRFRLHGSQVVGVEGRGRSVSKRARRIRRRHK